VKGRRIALSNEPAWKRLQGAAGGHDLMRLFAAHRKQERRREDSKYHPPLR
jgi:hypothetical protein